jgi:phage terminase large subunit-like protein
VLAGRIVVCEEVRLAVERQQRDLVKGHVDLTWPYRWDEWHAADVCDFIEKLPHVEGEWSTPTITLEPWQIFVLTTLFGWRRKLDGHRRFNTAYIEVARKNAKSVLAAGIGIYCLCCEGEVGPQVKDAATTGGQARIIFDVQKKMVEATPALAQAFDLEVLANSIVCHQNGGNITPINAKASTQDGLNPHCTIIDELHAHANRSLFDVLKSARGARQNPLSLYVTTAGYNMLGVCYEQRTMVTKILAGVFDGDHYFGIIYTLDEADDPYDETVWPKSNPNLGISVKVEEFRTYALDAKVSPESEGEYKTKRHNIWLSSHSAWLNMRQWDACADRALRLEDFTGQPCWIGGDLAQLDDLAAVALAFQRADIIYGFVQFYLPLDVVHERARAVPAYQIWANDRVITMTSGNMIDYGIIELDIRAWCKMFNVRSILFDQFGSAQIVSRLFNDGLPANVLAKTAKNFTPPARDLETRIRHGKFRHTGNPCLKWNASNCVVTRKIDDSILPKKESPESPNKIDGIDALLQAISGILTVQAPPEKKFQVMVFGR